VPRSKAVPLPLTADVLPSQCRYKEGELSVGENACIDRCSNKYWQVTGIVGQMLGAQGGMQ
jgi:hypothetical protein